MCLPFLVLQRRRHRGVVLFSPSPGQTFQHGDDRHGRDVRAAQFDDGVGNFRGKIHAGETRQSTQTFVDFTHKEREREMTRDVPVFGSLVEKKKKKREKNNVIKGLSFARFATTKKRRREESERRKTTTNRRRAHLVSSTVFPATRRRSCSFLTRVFVKTNGEKKDAFFWSTNSQKPKAIVYPPPLLPESGRVSPRLLRGAQRTLDQRLRPKRESPKYRPREVLEEDSKKEKKIHKGVDAQKTHRTKRS